MMLSSAQMAAIPSQGTSTALVPSMPIRSRKLVTCPETAHIEQIEYLEHPALGTLILGCSRFKSHCQLACERICAERLDRRDKKGV